MAIKIITTEDGSHTLFNEELNEHYHSTHGAINESKHIFIDAGYKALNPKHAYNILEIGYGTGLNALLTLKEVINTCVKINYVAIEAFPIVNSVYSKLNYIELIDDESLEKYFNELNTSSWNYPQYITDNFILNKIDAKIEDISLTETSFDLVYFDAFSPEVQPELWDTSIFEKIYNAMKFDGILVTYCAKGEVKRTLKSVGFEIENLPGPTGKREITRCRKVLLADDCKHCKH